MAGVTKERVTKTRAVKVMEVQDPTRILLTTAL